MTTLAFGTAMGTATGWPLLRMAGASVAVKSVLLWQIRWARCLDASNPAA